MKTILTFIGTVLIAVALGGVAYSAYLGAQTYQHAVRNQAVSDCLQTSTTTWAKTTVANQPATTVTEPNRFWVSLCMQEKGYELKTALN